MPQRFLRPDIRTSERWNETSFGAQSLYVGLMTLVDDFGRYDGRAKLIHGEVFILRSDVKPQQTAAWLNELHERDLIQLFDIGGKMFLQVSRWKERSRSETSRFPDPPARESCEPLRNPAESCLLSLSHKSSPLAISHKSLPNGKPTIKDVVELIGERAANDFFDYYESNGWRVGRNPMKDWRAAARRWKRNQKPNGARPDNPGTIDKSKIEVPERFKSWVSERYPARRGDAMKWRTWADVPRNGLRDEWWKEEKAKLPIGDML